MSVCPGRSRSNHCIYEITIGTWGEDANDTTVESPREPGLARCAGSVRRDGERAGASRAWPRSWRLRPVDRSARPESNLSLRRYRRRPAVLRLRLVKGLAGQEEPADRVSAWTRDRPWLHVSRQGS